MKICSQSGFRTRAQFEILWWVTYQYANEPQKGKPKIIRGLAAKEGFNISHKKSDYLEHSSSFVAGVVRGGRRANAEPFVFNRIRVNAYVKGDALVLTRTNGEFLTILDRSRHISSHIARHIE